MRLEELFSQYGYLMLLVGSLGEGMPIMLFGGFAAHRGWLVLIPTVILVGAIGNAMAQSVWFYGARYAGDRLLKKRAHWAHKVESMNHWLKRWETATIIGARFIPGVGSAALIAMALSDISSMRFAVLNMIGALIWAASLGVLGYVLGQALVGVLGEISAYEKPVAMALLVAGLGWIVWHQANRVRLMRRAKIAAAAKTL
jgi:membrane protein DedA with SNARE-associated domain